MGLMFQYFLLRIRGNDAVEACELGYTVQPLAADPSNGAGGGGLSPDFLFEMKDLCLQGEK